MLNLCKNVFIAGAVALSVVLGMSTQSIAGLITGGSLLSSGDLNQLENWVGEGELNVTNVYTWQTNHNAANFHQAVDNLGRSFTLIRINTGSESRLIGGYNPQSWTIAPRVQLAYNTTTSDIDRTAFLFNLTDTRLYRQILAVQEANNPPNLNWGQYQTYNYHQYGPTFGISHDLVISDFGNASILGRSYGDVTRRNDPSYQNELTGSYSSWTLEAMEVFTIEGASSGGPSTDVPEPKSLALLGVGIIGLGLLHRRRQKLSQK